MRKLGLLALVALLTLIPVSAASAKTKVEAFAAKHQLKGTWKGKDADKDGLKNLKEFKLGTNPRKADSDKDGLKDGDELASSNDPLKADTDGDKVKDGKEHAGVVTAFDGATVTFREFATGKKVTATLNTECTPAPSDDDEDVTADDSGFDDEGFDDEPVDEGEFFQVEDEGDEALADDDTCTDDDALEKGVVFQGAELDEDGFLVEYVLA